MPLLMRLFEILEEFKKWNELKFALLVSVLSLVLHSTFLTHLLGMMTIVQMHEMGHAIVANLGGIPALPIGVMGFTMWFSYNRIYIFALILILVQVYFLYRFYQNEKLFLFFVGLFILFINLKMTFFLPVIKLHQYISAGGLIGEILFPTIILSLFFLDIEIIPKWSFWKYVLSGYVLLGYTATLKMWYRIAIFKQSLPFGSALSSDGASDTNGDLNRLVSAGWTEHSIRQFYFNSVKMSLTIIIISIVYGFWLKLNDKDSEFENSESL